MTHARQEKFSAKIMLERHNNDRCIGPGDIDKASGLLDQQKRTGHKLTLYNRSIGERGSKHQTTGQEPIYPCN